MFRPTHHFSLDIRLSKRFFERPLHFQNVALALFSATLDLLYQSPVFLRLQKLECEVFKLPPDRRHTQAVGERSINLSRLESDPLTLILFQVLKRTHVVQSVGQLHKDNPCVLRHREEHLPVILDLSLRGGPEAYSP